MSDFEIYTIENAPEGSREALARSHNVFGFIPNLLGVMAEAPSLLQAYMAVWKFFDQCSLSPVERQVVYLSANYANASGYSMAGHSRLAEIEGVPGEVIEAIRSGAPIADPRLQALRVFTQKMVEQRARLEARDTQAVLAAGFTERHILEVILGVAIKVMSNYTNHLAQTPLDELIAEYDWSRPEDSAA